MGWQAETEELQKLWGGGQVSRIFPWPSTICIPGDGFTTSYDEVCQELLSGLLLLYC